MRALIRSVAALGAMAALLAFGACAPADEAASLLANTPPARVGALELRDTAFNLTRIEVGVGEVSEFALSNVGVLDHDLTIDRMPVATLVLGAQTSEHQAHASKAAVHAAPGPGKTVTLRLLPREAGEYAYYCSITGHREAGMTGTLVVSPPAGG